MNPNINRDDFEYAFETSKIIQEPAKFIDTFGITRFEFVMVCELMDTVGEVRVRSGVIEAQKPQIIKPQDYSDFGFEGFSQEAEGEAKRMLDWLKNNESQLAFLRYGFEFKKTETKSEIVHQPLVQVIGKLEEEARQKNNPSLAILEGVDETWEVALFKFTLEMIKRSTEVNVHDYKRTGLL